MNLDAILSAKLQELEQAGLKRILRTSELLPHGYIRRDGQKLLDLSSNDYLGLAREPLPDVNGNSDRNTSIGMGGGAGASRLVTGNHPELSHFEAAFAAYKGAEACLVFGSGYGANVGLLPALLSRHDIVFCDRLNHASILDGIVLSRARIARYRHRDLRDLVRQLATAPPTARKWIVTDAVFSMDGTIAPLETLVALKKRYNAYLIVDEAHSSGVIGHSGRGLLHDLGISADVEVAMGTFSKAYGVYGAYITGSQVMIDYLVQSARSLIYSTALPPVLLRILRDRWQLLAGPKGDLLRDQLYENITLVVNGLELQGWTIPEHPTAILPLLVGDSELALRFSEQLAARGICAVAIRPPTVPEGTARLRLSISAVHRQADLHRAVNIIGEVAESLGIEKS